jgi:hypothetical protein
MIITAQIDHDCRCLNRYFHKLFDILQEAIAEDQTAPSEVVDVDASDSQATYHRFSHLIKPDMIMNTYSLVDFWMGEICRYQKIKNNLSLTYRDIKGNHQLHAYQKYLTEYAGLDLNAVQDSYRHLDDLRKLRNYLIHSGGHVPSDKEKEFSAINGITLGGSLIVIDDSFVWITLGHVKLYLYAAAQA